MASSPPEHPDSSGPPGDSWRRKLGVALSNLLPQLPPFVDDDADLNDALFDFAEVVDDAAEQGVEVAFAWHTLGTWTPKGWYRIHCFERALKCLAQEYPADETRPDKEQAGALNMEADCLYQIGRVHFHEGDPSVAKDFLLRALQKAKEADERVYNDTPASLSLEGQIATLLVQLQEDAP